MLASAIPARRRSLPAPSPPPAVLTPAPAAVAAAAVPPPAAAVKPDAKPEPVLFSPPELTWTSPSSTAASYTSAASSSSSAAAVTSSPPPAALLPPSSASVEADEKLALQLQDDEKRRSNARVTRTKTGFLPPPPPAAAAASASATANPRLRTTTLSTRTAKSVKRVKLAAVSASAASAPSAAAGAPAPEAAGNLGADSFMISDRRNMQPAPEMFPVPASSPSHASSSSSAAATQASLNSNGGACVLSTPSLGLTKADGHQGFGTIPFSAEYPVFRSAAYQADLYRIVCQHQNAGIGPWMQPANAFINERFQRLWALCDRHSLLLSIHTSASEANAQVASAMTYAHLQTDSKRVVPRARGRDCRPVDPRDSCRYAFMAGQYGGGVGLAAARSLVGYKSEHPGGDLRPMCQYYDHEAEIVDVTVADPEHARWTVYDDGEEDSKTGEWAAYQRRREEHALAQIRALSDAFVGIVLEPFVLSRDGYSYTPWFLQQLSAVLMEKQLFLCWDEVWGCASRTGPFWSYQLLLRHNQDLIPDFIVFGKSMGISGLARVKYVTGNEQRLKDKLTLSLSSAPSSVSKRAASEKKRNRKGVAAPAAATASATASSDVKPLSVDELIAAHTSLVDTHKEAWCFGITKWAEPTSLLVAVQLLEFVAKQMNRDPSAALAAATAAAASGEATPFTPIPPQLWPENSNAVAVGRTIRRLLDERCATGGLPLLYSDAARTRVIPRAAVENKSFGYGAFWMFDYAHTYDLRITICAGQRWAPPFDTTPADIERLFDRSQKVGLIHIPESTALTVDLSPDTKQQSSASSTGEGRDSPLRESVVEQNHHEQCRVCGNSAERFMFECDGCPCVYCTPCLKLIHDRVPSATADEPWFGVCCRRMTVEESNAFKWDAIRVGCYTAKPLDGETAPAPPPAFRPPLTAAVKRKRAAAAVAAVPVASPSPVTVPAPSFPKRESNGEGAAVKREADSDSKTVFAAPTPVKPGFRTPTKPSPSVAVGVPPPRYPRLVLPPDDASSSSSSSSAAAAAVASPAAAAAAARGSVSVGARPPPLRLPAMSPPPPPQSVFEPVRFMTPTPRASSSSSSAAASAAYGAGGVEMERDDPSPQPPSITPVHRRPPMPPPPHPHPMASTTVPVSPMTPLPAPNVPHVHHKHYSLLAGSKGGGGGRAESNPSPPSGSPLPPPSPSP